MATFGRLLLWTLALLAPGGFLLVPVLLALRSSSHDEGALKGPTARAFAWLKAKPAVRLSPATANVQAR